jgi:hypothetical protein
MYGCIYARSGLLAFVGLLFRRRADATSAGQFSSYSTGINDDVTGVERAVGCSHV